MGAREALAEALAGELDMDLTPEFLAATDRVLISIILRESDDPTWLPGWLPLTGEDGRWVPTW